MESAVLRECLPTRDHQAADFRTSITGGPYGRLSEDLRHVAPISVGLWLADSSGRLTTRRSAVPLFDVRFIKTVCDATGHEHHACQAAFTVEAPSLMDAIRRAEADFCRQKRVHDWTIFADAVEFGSPTALERPSVS
jgi:hypothetical protein